MQDRIYLMTHANKHDYDKPNEGFMVTGRMIPKYEHDAWTYTEETNAEPYFKRYEDDEIDESYIEEEGKAVFLYYDENTCIGRIRLRANWNGFALVEDIAVSLDRRQRGVGAALMTKAAEWARAKRFCGLMLETQDVNVSACRFYARNGFVIGGVDTKLYANFPTADEKAIFWYRKF